MFRTILALACWLVGSLAMACPQPDEGGAAITAEADALLHGHAVPVIAGGPVDVAACSGIGMYGFMSKAPDVRITLGGIMPRTLELRTVGACDTVLAVMDAAQRWHFDDDGGGDDQAAIAIAEAPAGEYAVWVGSYHRGSCRARLLLRTAR